MKIAGKWVPNEPTAAMMAKGFIADEGCDDPAEVYRLMLAAAPQPDLEAMVEDCAASLPGNLYASWAVVPGDRKQHYRAIARAVLRHLFGE